MAHCCSAKTTALIIGTIAVLIYFILPAPDRSIPNLPPYVKSWPVIGNTIDNISRNKEWIVGILKKYGAVAQAWITFEVSFFFSALDVSNCDVFHPHHLMIFLLIKADGFFFK